MFDGLLSLIEDELPAKSSTEVIQEEENILLEPKVVKEELWEAMYIQACYWSFGATIVDKERAKFDEYMKKTSGFMLVQDTPDKLATISKLKKKFEKSNL